MRVFMVAAAVVNLIAAAPCRADGPFASATPEPYALSNTQVHTMHSTETGADYQLLIATPQDYRTAGKKYPVVYLLDAEYSFALTRNVVKHFVDRNKLPEMILVAIAYPGGGDDMETYKRNRKRDYTPSFQPVSTAEDADGEQEQGGAVRFRNFIADNVIPYVASKFPASADRTFVGHSFGGLFGTYVLLTEPELFKRYVIVSPSLWFNNRMILRVEKQTAARRQVDRRVERRVFFAIGSLETRAEVGAPMVDELKQFYRKLATRPEPGLEMTLRVYPDENHSSIFPSAITGGLLAVFPPPES